MRNAPLLLMAVLAASIPAVAQKPGAPDRSRVAAGTYQVDTNHTQVTWTVDHLGISPLSGAIGAGGGSLILDPARPAAARVTVTFRVADMTTTVPKFTQHLLSPDMFDAAKYPTASFTSTAVVPSGNRAKITGNLTIKGITRPVSLDATFFGAGMNPMSKKTNIGFSAKGRIKRSDFGLGYGLPMVGDELDLAISAAFERQ